MSFPPNEDREKTSIYELERGFSPDTESAGALILDS